MGRHAHKVHRGGDIDGVQGDPNTERPGRYPQLPFYPQICRPRSPAGDQSAILTYLS
ncbi:hypothetical protein KQR54_03445 [Mycobacterium gordonae]|uniref:hypothetical protein n=1 Tax=Mycobacterium gordonae TaxID=1778 RepID=UPI00210ACDF0|nr:hypothetical protein [Mycobacterium gordonae]MCQ4360212.1 hypothetical protein [Mycobacterium gordonae]